MNSKRFVLPADDAESQDTVRSVIELPEAPDQPWITRRPDAASGYIVQHQLRSKILGNERRIWVYTPPGYSPDGEPHRLLVLFDGDVVPAGVIPVGTILDNLVAEDQIPPTVAVLVDSLTQEERNRDPAGVTVAGQSYGGLAAVFAGLRRPDVLGMCSRSPVPSGGSRRTTRNMNG